MRVHISFILLNIMCLLLVTSYLIGLIYNRSAVGDPFWLESESSKESIVGSIHIVLLMIQFRFI